MATSAVRGECGEEWQGNKPLARLLRVLMRGATRKHSLCMFSFYISLYHHSSYSFTYHIATTHHAQTTTPTTSYYPLSSLHFLGVGELTSILGGLCWAIHTRSYSVIPSPTLFPPSHSNRCADAQTSTQSHQQPHSQPPHPAPSPPRLSKEHTQQPHQPKPTFLSNVPDFKSPNIPHQTPSSPISRSLAPSMPSSTSFPSSQSQLPETTDPSINSK